MHVKHIRHAIWTSTRAGSIRRKSQGSMRKNEDQEGKGGAVEKGAFCQKNGHVPYGDFFFLSARLRL